MSTLTPPIVNIQKAGLKRQEAGDSPGDFRWWEVGDWAVVQMQGRTASWRGAAERM